MRQSQSGRTVLETMTVMAIIGVLSVTGIYLYRRAINDVRADGIIKDVLARANQKKSSQDEKRLRHFAYDAEGNAIYTHKQTVYTPRYDKFDPTVAGPDPEKKFNETTKGRYGFSYEIDPTSTSAEVKIRTTGKVITTSVCNAIKSKVGTYKNGTFSRIMAIGDDGQEHGNILTGGCPNDVSFLKFYVSYGAEAALDIPGGGGAVPEPAPAPQPQDPDCPTGSGTGKMGQATGVFKNGQECRCDTTDQWNPASLACEPACLQGSLMGAGEQITGTPCYCGANEYYNSVNNTCTPCPNGTSLNGVGDPAEGSCKCNNAGEVWDGASCSIPVPPPLNCPGDKVPNAAGNGCECPAGKIEKTNDPNTCVECNTTPDCESQGEDYVCDNNRCEEKDDCRWGVCQTCDAGGHRQNLPNGSPCETSGIQGRCLEGNCYPQQQNTCANEGVSSCDNSKCQEGYFCNCGGNYDSGAHQNGNFGQTPNVCMKVNAKTFTYEDPTTPQKTTYYYAGKKDLQSWCRASDNNPNCVWGYLAKAGAQNWCASLGKNLLSENDLRTFVKDENGQTITLWELLRTKAKLPQTFQGYDFWIQEGAWIVRKNAHTQDWEIKNVDRGRYDGYVGKAMVICK